MKYRVFNTKEEAETAEKLISQQMGFVKAGTNLATGEVVESAVTTSWAVPVELQDGRWAFISPDDQGEEEQSEWWPEPVESLFALDPRNGPYDT